MIFLSHIREFDDLSGGLVIFLHIRYLPHKILLKLLKLFVGNPLKRRISLESLKNIKILARYSPLEFKKPQLLEQQNALETLFNFDKPPCTNTFFT